ncbi:MAG: YdcF family protein, partial [Acidobacteriia bacterium]|nr:YdcF family protein [Terriglobia bacterium]
MKKIALVLAAAVLLAAVFHTAILTALGSYLVKAGPPQKADIVIVLAGDASGHRILKAAQLVREGYASKVVVSGPEGQYDY